MVPSSSLNILLPSPVMKWPLTVNLLFFEKKPLGSSHNVVLHLLQIKVLNSILLFDLTPIISMNSFSTSKHWPHTSKFSRSFFFLSYLAKYTEIVYSNLVLWGSGIFYFIFLHQMGGACRNSRQEALRPNYQDHRYCALVQCMGGLWEASLNCFWESINPESSI